MKIYLIPVVVVSLIAAVRAEDQVTPNDQSISSPGVEATDKMSPDAVRQQGVWKPIAAVLGGVFLPPPTLEGTTLSIDGMNYEVTVEGEDHADRGTFTLDTTTTPKRMTIKGTDGPNKGKTIFAIYEMKNEVSMRVCYDLSGKEFPEDFKAPRGTQRYVAGYRKRIPGKTADEKKHILLKVDGKEVRIPVSGQLYEHWQKQVASPNATSEPKRNSELLMQVLLAAYRQGLKDATHAVNTQP